MGFLGGPDRSWPSCFTVASKVCTQRDKRLALLCGGQEESQFQGIRAPRLEDEEQCL